jgi:hypothetical protein
MGYPTKNLKNAHVVVGSGLELKGVGTMVGRNEGFDTMRMQYSKNTKPPARRNQMIGSPTMVSKQHSINTQQKSPIGETGTSDVN